MSLLRTSFDEDPYQYDEDLEFDFADEESEVDTICRALEYSDFNILKILNVRFQL